MKKRIKIQKEKRFINGMDEPWLKLKLYVFIGNRDADLTSNPLCLKSRRIPKFTHTSFSCAEPMLGRYVFIAAKDYFQLCDVQVFLNGKCHQNFVIAAECVDSLLSIHIYTSIVLLFIFS